jgi:hypothetical protein
LVFQELKKKNFYFLRKRKNKEKQMKEYELQRAEVQYQATLDHYKRLRQFKLQQIQTIQLLPACK